MRGEDMATAAVIRIAGTGISFAQQEDDPSILQAALRAGVGFPYECSSGGCGSCRYRLQSGKVDVLWPDAPGWSARDRRKGCFLACQTRAQGDIEITVRLGESYVPKTPPKRLAMRLSAVAEITHDMRRFVLEADEEAVFLPGQYAIFSMGEGVRRCYSMSNIANPDGKWEFIIRRVPNGRATSALFKARPGDTIMVDGPYGLAYLREDAARDLICVAGGSGLSPMLSILRGALASDRLAGQRIHFYYGARTPADVISPEQFRALAGPSERVRFQVVVSDLDAAAQAGWRGRTGFVHEAVREDFGERLAQHELYFAGPPPMTEAMQRMAMLDHQVPFEHIHFDRFF